MSLILSLLKPLPESVNMRVPERLFSGGAGLALLILSLRDARRSAWVYAVFGGALVLRAVTGRTRLHNGTEPLPTEGRDEVGWRFPGFRGGAGRGIRVERTFYVHRPIDEVYRVWRNFENLPHFLAHLERVEVTTPRKSRWVAKMPGGHWLEWESEMIEERPNQVIAWKSVPGAEVYHFGRVSFRELEGGTEFHLVLEYLPTGEGTGNAPARLFGREAGRQIDSDLLRFKHLMEVGG